ncbi:hypothetical protein MMC07_005218 [Pseudocyphellaria aurata]|nr:hypothetical protein [Pseudocyphellaria aurata]
MPDKPFTVITYAASASLAAIALIYFFNPNQLIDGDSSTSSASTRKKGIVGLSNPANDCFINSILQSLAGLGDLRLYLIRELHRRDLDGPAIYAAVPEEDANGKPVDMRKLASLQSGEVTQGLKFMIDNLNERPIYKKTISAGSFIQVLEHAFGTRISKSQQDAQELLQIVAERLAEEYYAGQEARKRTRQNISVETANVEITPPRLSSDMTGDIDYPIPAAMAEPASASLSAGGNNELLVDAEEGFPLEGQTEAQIECLHCRFVPKANPTSFVMLNLMVPQKSSTSLNECFDAHFKMEHIDDYKCDKCRLQHALDSFTASLAQAKTDEQRRSIETSIEAIQEAIQEDPETPPKGVDLPDISLAPKRRIARHVQIVSFPKVLIIHLSRSIYDPRSSSTKNTSKVSFPERLPLGSLLNRRSYKLLGMVCHRGTHNSGHYESFRRQHVYAPISTPHRRRSSGPYRTPTPSSLPSPMPSKSSVPPDDPSSLPLTSSQGEVLSTTTTSPRPSLSSLSPSSTRPSSGSVMEPIPPKLSVSSDPRSLTPSVPIPSTPRSSDSSKSIPVQAPPRPHSTTKLASSMDSRAARFRPNKARVVIRSKPQNNDRWWRISDDKIKECKTADVLGMQKDVYMLFYEMERE